MNIEFRKVVLYLLILIARKVLFNENTNISEWKMVTEKAHEIIDAKVE